MASRQHSTLQLYISPAFMEAGWLHSTYSTHMAGFPLFSALPVEELKLFRYCKLDFALLLLLQLSQLAQLTCASRLNGWRCSVPNPR